MSSRFLFLFLSSTVMLPGCSAPPLFRTVLYSIAPEPAYHVEVTGMDSGVRRPINGSVVLRPHLIAKTTFEGTLPDRVRVDWNYDSPPARNALFDLSDLLPGEGLGEGGIVILLEGRTARLGWMKCDDGQFFSVRATACERGGVLAEPGYENAILKRSPPIAGRRDRLTIPEKVR